MSTEPEKRSDEETRIEADLDVLVRCEPGTYDSDAAYERLQDTFGSLLAALAASRADAEALRASMRYATDENERLTKRAEQDSRGLDRWCHYQDRLYEQMTAAEIEALETRLGEDGWTNEPMCRHESALAAARVEVSQLRATVEQLRKLAARGPRLHADLFHEFDPYVQNASVFCKRCGNSEGNVYHDLDLRSVAEPLGSTPDQPATEEEERTEGAAMCERCDDVGCYSCHLNRFI